jgi:hypothetical protein
MLNNFLKGLGGADVHAQSGLDMTRLAPISELAPLGPIFPA